MASFNWQYPENHVSKDAEVIAEMFGENHGPLDVPDHTTPFIVGQYQAYPSPVPVWNSDYEQDLFDADLPSDRVLFDKLLNTRMPEDMDPAEYDELVFKMELMARNSPYREGVYRKQYSERLLDRLARPEYLSSLINQKASSIASGAYRFATEYLPSLPVRFLVWSFESVPARIESSKLALQEFTAPFVTLKGAQAMRYVPGVTTGSEVVAKYDLEGTTAVVTGASSGIGKEVAKNLASRGATLILPTRHVAACDQLALQWRTELNNPAIHCAECDLNEMSSVVKFLDELKMQKIVPDLLVNAAAVLKPFFTSSHRGTAHPSIGINLLSHMVLTDGIIELMEEDINRVRGEKTSHPLNSRSHLPNGSSQVTDTPDTISRVLGVISNPEGRDPASLAVQPPRFWPRRIVNVSCGASRQAALRSEEMTAEGLGQLTGVRAYNVSKLGNVAHAQATALYLARKDRARDIVVTSIDPGLVHGTQLFDNTFFSLWHARLGAFFNWRHVQSVETASAPILRLLLDPSLGPAAHGLHYVGYDVAESPLAHHSPKWITRFLNAIEDLRELATDSSVDQTFMLDLKRKEHRDREILEPKIKEMKEWYIQQSEQFEKSLDLPMPQMTPFGYDTLMPATQQERIGSKPLGIGPHDAPLIGDELRANWQHITDTYPVQIQELVRRRELQAPEPSPEQAAQIQQTQAEFDALKLKIMHERRLKSAVTSQYAKPLPPAAGEGWWSWVKAKVDHLTKPTIHE
jgi:NAD(P)-dependent dehydrogenase (short-subunit alcohol dehydrogenase family)